MRENAYNSVQNTVSGDCSPAAHAGGLLLPINRVNPPSKNPESTSILDAGNLVHGHLCTLYLRGSGCLLPTLWCHIYICSWKLVQGF